MVESQKSNLFIRLSNFIESEARSCSMDYGRVTAEYVYRMWGGEVALYEIEQTMKKVRPLS